MVERLWLPFAGQGRLLLSAGTYDRFDQVAAVTLSNRWCCCCKFNVKQSMELALTMHMQMQQGHTWCWQSW